MKQQKQLIALVVLMLIAAFTWFWNSRQAPQTAPASTVASTYTPMSVENPAIQSWKVSRVQKTEYKPSGRNPFDPRPPAPPPPKVPKPGDTNYVPPAPVIPPPPELPLKFFGYGTVPNGTARRAFLSDGDEVYIVAEGDVLLGRFRILKIGNATIEFEEVGSGRQGRSNIEDVGPAA